MTTPYKILGVEPDASTEEIRTAYRRLARTIHPDASGAPLDAQLRMAEVNEAWSVLGDPVRRHAYDAAAVELAGTVEGLDAVDPVDVVVPASPVEAIVPLASAIGVILAGLGFAGGAPGITFVGVFLIGVAIVAFLIRRKRL